MRKILLPIAVIVTLLIPMYDHYANALSIPPLVPSPTNLTANAVSSSAIDLAWDAPSNLQGLLIVGYEIDRSTNGGSTWSVLVSNTESTSTSYSDTGLPSGTTYTYRISAITLLATSSPSNTASATTPSPQSRLAVSSQDSSGNSLSGFFVTLSQSGSQVDSGYTPYTFTLSDGQTYTVQTDLKYKKYVFSHWLDTGSTSYTRTISISSNSQITSVYGTTPKPPTGLSASTVSSSQINLRWTAPSNNGGFAITGYEIDISTDGGSTWSTLVSNTASTATTYSDTGLSPGTSYTYRISAINSAGTSSPSNSATATTASSIRAITLTQSGLVVSDSLTNETRTQQQLQSTTGYWIFGGDAPAENATYNFYRDTLGFHIGAKATSDGKYAGYYAESQPHSAHLWHAIISTPISVLPTTANDYYENGLYVQTSNGAINYVSCFSDTSQWGTVWAVGSVTGNNIQGTQFNILWVDTSANQPLTRDCTLVTNGQNLFKAYIDGELVYTNSTMNLQMPAPFNAYLEPQSSYPRQLLNGTYTNYYATADETVKITNLSSNAAQVDLVDSSGNVLASSAASSGQATMTVGQYDFPLAASIKVYDSNNNLLATTSNTVGIYGGDVYAEN